MVQERRHVGSPERSLRSIVPLLDILPQNMARGKSVPVAEKQTLTGPLSSMYIAAELLLQYAYISITNITVGRRKHTPGEGTMPSEEVHSAPLTILLVEDNIPHAELVKRSLETHQIANRVYHVADGEAALDYLFRQGVYADPVTSPRPHVVLLDLRLPKLSGLEVLREIRSSSDSDLHTVPVVVLTTSAAERDITRAYEQRANSYLVKPVDFGQFMQLIHDLGLYWLGWNYYAVS
jgi:CheY-like chemotaxis protein